MRIERRGSQLVAVRPNGSVTSRQTAPLLIRAITPGSFVTWNGKRYRGELVIRPNNGGLLVVNRLGVESYLRGVVPLEIGGVAKPGDEAAVEAQAVAARSYSYVAIRGAGDRAFDMYASVQDQAYGGVDAEQTMSDRAIENTRNMVLRYAGRIINTPYSSTCGGRTAEVREVWWRRNDEPYLRSVSDQIPGTDKYYCDISGRFRWTTTFDQAQLRESLEKYIATVTPEREPAVAASATARRALGRITGFDITSRTPHDRVATVSIQTERGNYVVRGNDVRFVLRTPSGGLLNSTYFTAESRSGPSGAIEQLTIRGGGWGHGIGMCQWGAIGRARAGQDYKTILTSYYQGTSVERVDS
jgi:stage II sporulation protein D